MRKYVHYLQLPCAGPESGPCVRVEKQIEKIFYFIPMSLLTCLTVYERNLSLAKLVDKILWVPSALEQHIGDNQG